MAIDMCIFKLTSALMFITLALAANVEAKAIVSAVSAKSQFGMKASQQEPCTAASYIHDGLILMWDGIENVDYGVHDPSAAQWKDLVQGYTLFQRNGTWTWDDNSFGCSGKDSLRPRYSGGYESNVLFAEACNAKVFTIEIIAKRPDTQPIHSADAVNPAIFGYFRFGANTTQVYYDALARSFFTSPRPCIWVIQRDGAIVKTWVNGQQSLESTSSTTPSVSGVVSINGTVTASGNAARWHAFRVYNRALSDAEVKHNYKVDKKRFGL